MLEVGRIAPDIDNLGRERASFVAGIPEEFRIADEVMVQIANDLAAAREKMQQAKTSWLTSLFDEPPNTIHKLSEVPLEYAVTATDGSQVMPDKHEVTFCYLLNTSSVIIYYGNGDRPVADTRPKLYYKEDDLFESPYGGRRARMNEKLIGIRRTLAESTHMRDAICAAVASGIPTVALWDGSLIRWSLEGEPQDYRERVLKEYLQLFEMARELGVPVAGYISDPGSGDVVNSLRIMLCHEDKVDCDCCPHERSNESRPCDTVVHLRDVSIFRRLLRAGDRSALFRSASKILDYYGDHRTLAFYLHTGREIARIEIPKWVADSPMLLNLVHAVCYDQAQKGRGYPVALAQAHEHAVIRHQEARIFYEMVERALVKHGAPVTYSLKRLSKAY